MIPDKVVFNNAIEENDQRLENIIDMLKQRFVYEIYKRDDRLWINSQIKQF